MPIETELQSLANEERAAINKSFFKTGKGQYGEGDQFIGIRVPELRKVAKKYKDLPLEKIEKLLQDPIHEYRLTALFILILQYQEDKEKIVQVYRKHYHYVNNWDLVDISAPKILGDYLLDKERTELYTLVQSPNMWQRRIAIVCTFTFIRNKDFTDTIKLAEALLNDKEDLMHKATGWMLREVGKKDVKVLEKFLDKYHKVMPRTMLRYAIEKFDKEKRLHYMKR